jgi:hypothetical protein
MSLLAKALISSFVGDGVIDKGYPVSATCDQCSSEFQASEGRKTIKGMQTPETLCITCKETQQKELWRKWLQPKEINVDNIDTK